MARHMDQSLWQLTVVRTHGLRLIRPEKAWRPIVRVEIDKHYTYETVLGCDGQSVNLKDAFSFQDADIDSMLDIRVFYQSQTKKKGKRKREVAASTGHPLGQLIKKQEIEQRIELRLQCQNKNTCASRGKPQNGASVILRIRPPPSYASSSKQQEDADACTSDTESSHTLAMPPSPTDTDPPLPISINPPQQLRRRCVGYAIYSDEEPCSSGEEEDIRKQPLSFSHFTENDFPNEDDIFEQEGDSFSPIPIRSTFTIAVEKVNTWIAASLLPQYTQEIKVLPPSLNPAERIVSTFTLYSELKEAGTESDYEPIFERLQREWQYVGGLLAALAAVNAAVFAISPGSLFEIQPYALSAIAGSSIASGLGMAIDAWFLFRYNWVDLKTFIFRARDLYGSYFFFALSARMPAMCMLSSTLALMAFLGFVAFEVWPQGVVFMCFFAGLVMSLQFLVFGAHWCATKIAAGGRASREGMNIVVRRMTQTSV